MVASRIEWSFAKKNLRCEPKDHTFAEQTLRGEPRVRTESLPGSQLEPLNDVERFLSMIRFEYQIKLTELPIT